MLMGVRRCRRGIQAIVGTIFAAWALLAAPAGAAPRPVFRFAGVAVDETAESAAKAREIAVAHGQRAAFDRLVRRIVVQADQGLVPRPEAGALSALVEGIEFAAEKTSATRYLASLTVTFKEAEVKELLRRAGARYSQTAGKPVLVLPLYESGDRRLLWEEDNPWRAAWAATDLSLGLVPLVLPLGDVSDLTSLTADQAAAGDAAALTVLARRYGTEKVLVARASQRYDFSAGAPSVAVSLEQHDGGKDQVVIEMHVAEPGDTVDTLLARAARASEESLQEAWKQETLLRFDSEARLSATIEYRSLKDWLEVQRRLADVAAIRRVQIETLSTERAQVVLHYLGDTEQLAVALAPQDLELSQAEGYWRLKRRDGTAGRE